LLLAKEPVTLLRSSQKWLKKSFAGGKKTVPIWFLCGIMQRIFVSLIFFSNSGHSGLEQSCVCLQSYPGETSQIRTFWTEIRHSSIIGFWQKLLKSGYSRYETSLLPISLIPAKNLSGVKKKNLSKKNSVLCEHWDQLLEFTLKCCLDNMYFGIIIIIITIWHYSLDSFGMFQVATLFSVLNRVLS
jgi:hypothetical protein